MSETKQSALGAAAAFDLNWGSDWVFDGSKLPQEVRLDLQREVKLSGLIYKPSINGNNRVRAFGVYVSDDGENWGEPVGRFQALFNLGWASIVLFDRPYTVRHLRIVITDGFGDQPELRVGEFEPWLE